MVKKIIGIGILVVIVLSVVWWYFTFKYVPKGEEFDLQYSNLELLNSTGEPEQEKYEIRKFGLYTRTYFNVNNEELIYTFEILNDGTLDAKLKYAPIYLRTDMYFKKHIKYDITYLDGKEIKAGDEIKSGETRAFKVKIHFNSPDVASQNAQFYESYIGLIYVRK